MWTRHAENEKRIDRQKNKHMNRVLKREEASWKIKGVFYGFPGTGGRKPVAEAENALSCGRH